ncbi:unnamed protein product, partial [Ectocarpus sp. 8 AP-2014]
MLLFVLLIESCMPSAQNSVIMLQVRVSAPISVLVCSRLLL